MCIPTKLQQNIISFTKDGEHIARFLAETLRGETPGVKVCHRMEAAKHLIRYGFPDEARQQGQFDMNESKVENIGNKTPSPSRGEGWDGGEDSPSLKPVQVTHLDIINYEIAHLIRHETADGHTVVNFLVNIMSGRDRPFTPKKFRIKPADRMAAARELLRRGFGDFGSRRKLSDTTDEANAYDTLHTDLAKRMREYSERGAAPIRFLLEVVANPNPEEEFTIHFRMSAAQELLRRGWDTNYDNIKSEQLQDYWRDGESTRLSIGQKKTQAGLSTSIDDYDNYDNTNYEAIALQLREDEGRDVNSKPLRFQETVPSSCHSSESRNLEDLQGVTENPPLSQGEGWGEGKEKPLSSPTSKSDNTPSTPTLPLSKSEDEPTDRKAIIKEFKEAMDRGDERAALRAEAKYRRIDIKAERNIYDYGPNDPDPTIDYYFEPLNSEQQAKFDQEERREYGLTEEEIADFSGTPTQEAKTDPLEHLTQAAATHNTPILPNPLAAKRKTPTIRSP